MSRRTALIALFMLAAAQPGGADPVPEPLVRLGFIYNIAKLTYWPDDAFSAPAAPLTLCLLGRHDSDANPLASLADKIVQGRAVEVRREDRVSQLARCQLLFLDEEDEPRVAAVLPALRALPVLTVGAFDGFAEAGGMVSLFREGEQMHLKFNNDAVLKARLRINAQLLRMGEVVKGAEP